MARQQSKYLAQQPCIVENLLQLYSKRTDTDESLGSAWYPNARQLVLEWSNTYHYTIPVVANVIAALSPQCAWERNLIIAEDLLAGRLPSIRGCLILNLTKATRIRNDGAEDITPYFPTGPKVAAFAANLIGDDQTVTVDTHAAQAALDDVRAIVNLKPIAYHVFAAAYRSAASSIGIVPAEFQAILWHTWKRMYPPAIKRNHRRQWDVIGEL